MFLKCEESPFAHTISGRRFQVLERMTVKSPRSPYMISGHDQTGEARTSMRRNIIAVGLLCLPLTITTACRRGDDYGVLVAKFDDDGRLFKTKIFLPAAEDNYRFNFELRHGDTVCSLTGQLGSKELIDSESCEGIGGNGKITCNDDRSRKLRWSMTSCSAGNGRSIGKKGRHFYFGFDRNKDRALDQLAKAQRAN